MDKWNIYHVYMLVILSCHDILFILSWRFLPILLMYDVWSASPMGVAALGYLLC